VFILRQIRNLARNNLRTLRQRETGGTVRTEQSGIDPNSNRIVRQAGGGQAVIWRHDAAGNLLDDGRRRLEYDSRGRLLAALSGSKSARYRIDAWGRRIRKQISGGESLDHHYDENGRLISENRPDGSPVREIAYLEEIPVAVILEGSEVLYIHADHLGSPRALADGSGRIVWRWENNDPYGDNPAEEDPDGDGRRIEFNHRFPGQYLDRETGLHYNYYRDYDPATGRYTTSDPIGLAGGINTYSYVNGNPVSYTDPLGLQAILAPSPGLPGPPISGGTQGKGNDGSMDGLFPPGTFPGNTGSNGGPMSTPDPVEAAAGNQVDTAIQQAYSNYASNARMNCPGNDPDDRCTWLSKNAQYFPAAAVRATAKAWGCRGSRWSGGSKY